MTFADVAKLAPYFSQLGISHVYLSPIFRAAPGSTHGYDTADFNEVDPSLGGLDGFRALISELKKHSLGVIVDFVPNHMAADTENPWWRDALEWGVRSHYAQHFDIDWSAPKLLVTMLGNQYVACLREREIFFEFAPATGEFAACYCDNRLPLDPRTYERILGSVDDRDLRDIGAALSQAVPETAAELKRSLMNLATSKQKEIDDALNGLNANPSAVHAILEAQPWRLAYWRTAREMLTYRRFFEISDLVGVRVERPEVFSDVHRTILDLVKDATIDGLRIDHVDGLADPLGYLRQLREATAAAPGFYLVVEKILGENEDVRPEWPIDGTTGYEFIREIAGLFMRSGLDELDKGYREFTAVSHDYERETLDVKRRTLSFNLASELNGLVSVAFALGQADVASRDFGRDTLRSAIIEIAVNFPVYRTYVTALGPSALDQEILASVSHSAKATRKVEDHAAVDFIIALLSARPPSKVDGIGAAAFAVRFQQTTGPLMAKAVEDTEFYRFSRLIALNEVGGEPIQAGTGPDRFHAAMLRRQSLSPRGLTATATHDTKRGEDARTRLYAIGGWQKEWCAAVRRWSQALNAGGDREKETALDRETEWLFYQALAGAWPRKPFASALIQRMLQFMRKAAREAKLHTSWTDPDRAYESRIESFVRRALDPEHGFVDDFEKTIQPLIAAGAALSLLQVVLKVFAPGVPDIYQGTELWDLSLVDPDNRSAVDYGLRSDLLFREDGTISGEGASDGSLKLELLRRSLALRGTFDFTAASYHPLAVEGNEASRVIAFARHTDEHVIIVVGAIPGASDFEADQAFDAEPWQDTRVRISLPFKRYQFASAFSERVWPANCDYIEVAAVLGHLPVAVLHSAG
jgi:(1->4)-alpha-D-glucan 1-alpha-D-glucosylmutase